MELLMFLIIFNLGYSGLIIYALISNRKHDKFNIENLFRLYQLEKERHSGFKERYYRQLIHEILEEYEINLNNYQGENLLPMETAEENLVKVFIDELGKIKQNNLLTKGVEK